MEPLNRHPLESITNSSSLSMLETLIPFVEYPLKLPLALFIKFNEIRLIINIFRSHDNLSKFGLHNASSNPMDMISSLTGISPEMLQLLLSLSENLGDSFSSDILSGLTGKSSMDFSNIANMFQQTNTNREPTENNFPFPFQTNNNIKSTEGDDTGSDFDLNIQNILAEYDMMQAEQLNLKHSSDSTNTSYNSSSQDQAQNISQNI